MTTRRIRNRRAAKQAGQAFLAIVVLVAIFLLGVLGLATDYTQIWAHRQMVQAAADAACQAGAADIFIDYKSPGLLSNPWIGTAYNCSTNTSSSPCVYAAANGGYSGSNVSVSFPSSVSGVSSIPTGFGTIANPFIKVTVTESVPMSFSKITSGTSSVNIQASAVCGLQPVSVPIPLVVLHTSAAGSLSKAGTSGSITIIGGPNRSIQVDSSDPGAVSVSGSGTQIDLTQAGPNNNGADFGVFGSETQPSQVSLGTVGKWLSPALPYGDPWSTVSAPSVPSSAGKTIPQPFGWDGCPDPNGCVEFTPGNYTSCSTANTLIPGDVSGSTPGCIMLPWGGSNPNFRSAVYDNYSVVAGGGSVTAKQRIIPTGGSNPAHTRNNCNCVYEAEGAGTTGASTPLWGQSTPTDYQTPGAEIPDGTVTWRNIGPVTRTPATAIFAPGIYYVGTGGFNLGTGATVRVASAPDSTTNTWRGNSTTANGDGTSGVMFYFSTTATLAVTAAAGASSGCTSVAWSSGAYSISPSNCIVSYSRDGTLSGSSTGNVPSRGLQCPGASTDISQVPSSVDGNILYGPCSGTYGSGDSSVHGFLFYQAHSVAASPSWGGSGKFLLAGFMYFHNSSYGDSVSLQGSSGSTSYTLGNMVVDKISLGGGATIKMILNPAATYQILRPTLVQ